MYSASASATGFARPQRTPSAAPRPTDTVTPPGGVAVIDLEQLAREETQVQSQSSTSTSTSMTSASTSIMTPGSQSRQSARGSARPLRSARGTDLSTSGTSLAGTASSVGESEYYENDDGVRIIQGTPRNIRAPARRTAADFAVAKPPHSSRRHRHRGHHHAHRDMEGEAPPEQGEGDPDWEQPQELP
jgi:hypothetical protein